VRLPAIATAAARIKAESFPIDGEAVVLGPDGLSRFDELRRREAAHSAMLYAFDGQDLRDLPFLDRKAALTKTMSGSFGIGKGGLDPKAVLFWAFVAIPLAWGVWQTLVNAIKIF
jgi:ATP-dependent DNA ligase